jgi:hypothetical protein
MVRLCRSEPSHPIMDLVQCISALAFLPRASQCGARGLPNMALPSRRPSPGRAAVRVFTFVTPTGICSSWSHPGFGRFIEERRQRTGRAVSFFRSFRAAGSLVQIPRVPQSLHSDYARGFVAATHCDLHVLKATRARRSLRRRPGLNSQGPSGRPVVRTRTGSGDS